MYLTQRRRVGRDAKTKGNHDRDYPIRNNSAAICLKVAHVPLLLGLAAAVMLFALTGCKTSQSAASDADLTTEAQSAPIVLREGDTLRISFPGAPTLNTVQLIRRDGRITLPIVGEFHAAGMTPAELEQELLKSYGPQLQTKEVSVSVEASAFPIYITGAVLRPGRINADRPLTALEAVLEAGIDYTRANLKAVRVIRNQDSEAPYHVINLKQVLEGRATDDFKLRPQDVVYVPEKFSWF